MATRPDCIIIPGIVMEQAKKKIEEEKRTCETCMFEPQLCVAYRESCGGYTERNGVVRWEGCPHWTPKEG